MLLNLFMMGGEGMFWSETEVLCCPAGEELMNIIPIADVPHVAHVHVDSFVNVHTCHRCMRGGSNEFSRQNCGSSFALSWGAFPASTIYPSTFGCPNSSRVQAFLRFG